MKQGVFTEIKNIGKNLIDLIYPLHCQICGVALDPLDEYHLCDRCIREIKKSPKPYYKRFGELKVYSACLYEGILKELIHMFKYNKKLYLSKILSKILIDFEKENAGVTNDLDLIIPVPLHPTKAMFREFNQSKILASSLSREFGIPASDVLTKVKRTKPQSDLKKDERLLNLKGVFKIKDLTKVAGKAMLIIDDVLTTGSTLGECSKILMDAGAGKVQALTLAGGA